jgi:hypothetical protein
VSHFLNCCAIINVENNNCDIVFLPRPSPIVRPREHFIQQEMDKLLCSKFLPFLDEGG